MKFIKKTLPYTSKYLPEPQEKKMKKKKVEDHSEQELFYLTLKTE